MSINKVILVGNVGQQPEIRTTQNGSEIATFSLATTDQWKDKSSGEKKSKTEWHKIVVFQEGIVKIVKSLIKKGSKIYLEGSLQTRKWQDQSGQDKFTTEIVLQGYTCKLEILDRRDDSGSKHEDSSESGGKSSGSDFSDENEDIDEVPF